MPTTLPSRSVPQRNPWRHFQSDPVSFLRATAAEHGDTAEFRLGRHRITLLAHPEDIRTVLVTNAASFVKGPGLLRTRDLLGDGLLTSDGPIHESDRRALLPAFSTTAALGEYAAVMVDAGRKSSAQWSAGDAIDVHREMTALALSIASRCFFGIDLGSDASTVGPEVLEAIHSGYARLMPANERSDHATGHFPALEETAARGLAACPIHHTRVAEGLAKIAPERHRGHAMTLMLAGHESLSNALTWAFYLLNQYPEARLRMEAEIDALSLDEFDAPFLLTQRLPYTRAVFAETLRLYPPAWLLTRRATAKVDLADGTVLPGDIVALAPCVTHVDNRWFENPLTYSPERWLNGWRPQRNAYFPFGSGPRLCVGEPFAWAEGILLLAVLGRQWRLNFASDAEPVYEALVTLRPKAPLVATLSSRHP